MALAQETPLPPGPPLLPAPPPFAPCADRLHGVGNGRTDDCEGAPCSCDFVFSRWRGSDSIASYCEYVIQERLGHLFDESDAMRFERIYTVCPGTCATMYKGPCAGPAPPSPPPLPALPPFPPCADLLHGVGNGRTHDCEGAPCSCDFVFSRWRGEDSIATYCNYVIQRRLGHLFDESDAMRFERIYTVCPGTCAGEGVGPCANEWSCTDKLPGLVTSEYAPCDGGPTGCTCTYVFSTVRPSITSETDYCDLKINERIGYLFEGGWPNDDLISWLCPATCASYHRGPCAPPAPPISPPPPLRPPFSPCSDMLPLIMTQGFSFCNAMPSEANGATPAEIAASAAMLMADPNYVIGDGCTCEFVFNNWRGQDSIAEYCDLQISERLSHFWRWDHPGEIPEGPISNICQVRNALVAEPPQSPSPQPPLGPYCQKRM